MNKILIFFIVLAHLWPVIGRATVIAKKSLFYILPFGIACWLWGTIFINRADKGVLAVLNKEAKAITEKQVKSSRNTSIK